MGVELSAQPHVSASYLIPKPQKCYLTERFVTNETLVYIVIKAILLTKEKANSNNLPTFRDATSSLALVLEDFPHTMVEKMDLCSL
jgi:hypothetical protein